MAKEQRKLKHKGNDMKEPETPKHAFIDGAHQWRTGNAGISHHHRTIIRLLGRQQASFYCLFEHLMREKGKNCTNGNERFSLKDKLGRIMGEGTKVGGLYLTNTVNLAGPEFHLFI